MATLERTSHMGQSATPAGAVGTECVRLSTDAQGFISDLMGFLNYLFIYLFIYNLDLMFKVMCPKLSTVGIMFSFMVDKSIKCIKIGECPVFEAFNLSLLTPSFLLHCFAVSYGRESCPSSCLCCSVYLQDIWSPGLFSALIASYYYYHHHHHYCKNSWIYPEEVPQTVFLLIYSLTI